MAGRNNPENSGERFAVAIPLECSIGADGVKRGSGVICASDEEARDALKEKLTGLGMICEPDRGSARASFGFTGSWKAPWEPTGPKKNWGSPPSDPTRN